jgi:hypothetical protein
VLVVGVVVALFTSSVVVGITIADGDDGGDDAVAGDPTSGEPLTEADLDALVERLSAFVADARSLPFREDVDVEVLDVADYRRRILHDLEEGLDAEGREDLEHVAGAYQALGFWPSGTDPVEIVRRFSSVGSLGFYDSESAELVVLGSEDTPNLRVTLVHELTHALDDQHFDLDRFDELAERDDESAAAFRALVEGDATAVENAYVATLSGSERREMDLEQREALEGVDIGGIPPILFVEQELVYTSGGAFVADVLAEGGNDAIDDALEDPPTTTEQILEPEDWPERDEIVEVEVPDADGEVLESGALGQAFLGMLVNGLFGAGRPVPEWDGDNSVTWADGDEFCIRFAVAGDAEGYEEELGEWAERVDADLAVDDDLLVATSCG